MRRGIFIHKILLTWTFALISAMTIHAQSSATTITTTTTTAIEGRVTDPQGAGVPGATVILYARARTSAARLSTMTDDAGAFRFERLAPGAYLVEAEANGFARTTARETSAARGATARLDITLEVAGVETEVVVTASDTPQPVDEVSKAITVVGRREIEERDEFSIAEALRTVPGLRVQQSGGPGTLTTIRTRGLRTHDTAVLIDGLRFRDSTTLQGDAASLLSDLIVTNPGRVEVLRGSGSSLYGTNAIGGVVNVVTDEGGGPFRGSLFAEGGGLGFFRGRAQAAGGTSDNRILYSVGATHLNVTRGVDGDDAARNTSAQGRVLFRLSPTTTISARIYAADAFVQLNESPQGIGSLPAPGIIDAVPLSPVELGRYESGTPLANVNAGAANFVPSANDPDFSQATRFFSAAFTFAQRLDERFGYSVSYQAFLTDRAFRDGPAGPGQNEFFSEPFGTTSNEFDGQIHTLNARTDFTLGRSNFINAGYEFESENYVNLSFPERASDNSSIDVTQRSHTFFVQDQLRLMDDRLQLSAAFRAQFFSLDTPRFTPSAGAPYQAVAFAAPPDAYTGDGSIAYLFRSTGTKLRGHVGNGYRAPSLFERFGTFFSSFTGTFTALGDPTLRPERAIAFDAGVDQTLYNNRLRVSATYFYTRLQEVVDFGAVTTFDRPFGGYLNTRGGLARGLELSMEAAPTRSLDLSASYTHTNSDAREPRFGVIKTFTVPDHQFSLVATQRLGRRLLVNFDFVASSNYLAPVFDNRVFQNFVYRFDGLRKADLGASYTLPLAETRSVRFFGRIENLFDRDYFENGFRTPGVTGKAGAVFNF